MENTLFSGLVEKYFRQVIGKITEKYNDKLKENPLLHKSMLTEEYSADLTWGSTEISQSIVAADVVALDSSLPLKKRGKITNASGKLPKLGIKYRKGEKAISDINVMIARGTDEATVASKVFDDASKVIKAIDVRTEIMFLQGLSTGLILTQDEENGTGIRVDFGYKPENTFHCLAADWGQAGCTPQDDIQQLFDKANTDGNSIAHVYISKHYFDLFRKSEQGRLLAANYLNHVVTDVNLLSVPSRNTFIEALGDEYGATFHVVDASFRYEKPDGTTESIHPWEQPNVVGVPAEQVGRLVYGTLAEETNPVEGVSYEKSGTHILVSKYSKTDPLEEYTAGQSLCIPVIDGVDGIYMLHADAGTTFEVEPETLTFTSARGSQTFEIHYDGDMSDVELTTPSADTWISVNRRAKVVTVTCQANTASGATARTSTVTVTVGAVSHTVAISQGA